MNMVEMNSPEVRTYLKGFLNQQIQEKANREQLDSFQSQIQRRKEEH